MGGHKGFAPLQGSEARGMARAKFEVLNRHLETEDHMHHWKLNLAEKVVLGEQRGLKQRDKGVL